jgi:membrane protein implicated in regulation of membrane protease activity
MDFWIVYIIIAVIAIIIEMMVPTLFCINFAVAGIITAIVSVFWGTFNQLLMVFLALSLLSILVLRPILKNMLRKEKEDNFKSEYIGKVVKTIEPVTTTSGAVTIYEERWEARLKEEGEEIPTNTDVKIVDNESIVLYVEKLKGEESCG